MLLSRVKTAQVGEVRFVSLRKTQIKRVQFMRSGMKVLKRARYGAYDVRVNNKACPYNRRYAHSLKNNQFYFVLFYSDMVNRLVYQYFFSAGGSWSTDGCEMISANDSYFTCNCYHLTSFAILMQVWVWLSLKICSFSSYSD